MRSDFLKKIILINLAVIMLLVFAGILASDNYTSQPEFCGSCHIMKTYYDSWKSSEHGKDNIKCVECHYSLEESRSFKGKFRGLRQVSTYLSTNTTTLRKPITVSDFTCQTSECHPKEKFLNKKIKFTEKVPFIHKTHEDKKIEGQTLHCDTCHQNVRAEKHFEVAKEICFLCHFKNTKFNEGRARCELCHELSTKSLHSMKPLQSQKKETNTDEKTITHQSLEEAKVPCQSCHYEIIQGKGEIKKQGCYDCHKNTFEIEEKKIEKRIMHAEHVAGQHVAGKLAKCFDCHERIMHQKSNSLDLERLNCSGCHPDHHIYEKMLLVGNKRKGVQRSPNLMYEVNTTCFGCHRDERVINGEKVKHSSGKACAACHTEKHESIVKEWKDKTEEELRYAKEIEKDALDAVKNARGKISGKKLIKAKAMLKEGQENLHIVEYGDGVHNKKYSIMLIDVAMNKFEDLIELLSESDNFFTENYKKNNIKR
jgi:nitrate/TMAO reductase-like tetraheme cytochrome c subunit